MFEHNAGHTDYEPPPAPLENERAIWPFERQRARMAGQGDVMYPGEQHNARVLNGAVYRLRQLVSDALSAFGRPVQNSLPEKDREPAFWLFDTTNVAGWGSWFGPGGSLEVWDGRPLTFKEDTGVRPHLAPWNPWTQYPNIARERPGARRQPILGESGA